MNAFLFTTAVWIAKYQILFSIAALLALATYRVAATKLTFLAQRNLARAAVVGAIAAPILMLALPEANVLKPAVQVGADIKKSTPLSPHLSVNWNTEAPSPEATTESKTLSYASFALLALTLASIAFRSHRLIRDRRRLKRIVSNAISLRKYGHVSILASSQITIPFAARKRGQALVLLPQELLASPQTLRLTTQHELQHFRQGDLGWSALLAEGVRVIFGWNPILRKFLDASEERDELACDEALLGRRSFDNHAYATCLYEVAESAAARKQQQREFLKLAGTAGMGVSPNFLKRRIEMIFSKRSNHSRWTGRLAAALIVIATTGAAWAGEGLIVDHRISRTQALELAKKTQSRTGIPVVINQRVLDWLNRSTGTPRGRYYMRNALKRMRTYDAMISARLSAASLPSGLLALPLMESGYQNTETPTSAGIWQFIPQTARIYGLRVDDEVDERLNADKETGAAALYLSSNVKMFNGDWPLALLSYNAGENYVAELVRTTGSRDVFRWADEGRLKDENANYVPKFMASLIIMMNPELVKP